eukprot:g28424.t1
MEDYQASRLWLKQGLQCKCNDDTQLYNGSTVLDEELESLLEPLLLDEEALISTALNPAIHPAADWRCAPTHPCGP